MNCFVDLEYKSSEEVATPSSLDSEGKISETLTSKASFSSRRGARQIEKTCYHWKKTEQKKYVNFLFENIEIFNSSDVQRRISGVHLKMSKVIKSRDSNQCRSHHQKMMTKYSSVNRIIEEFKELLYPRHLNVWSPKVEQVKE